MRWVDQVERPETVTPFACATMNRRAFVVGSCLAAVGLLMQGCVDQHPYQTAAKEQGQTYVMRLATTSVTVAQMCDKLGLDLLGVPEISSDLPARYASAASIGVPMSPDLETIRAMHLDYVLSPNSLESDLQPKYAGIAQACIFLDLLSVQGLYESLAYLGRKFDRADEAEWLIADYRQYIEQLQQKAAGQSSPRVLILMGVPGSYVVATNQSYVGSLLDLAGGQNVYKDESGKSFVNVNTEDMLVRDPDVILRTAHALPDQVAEMFAEEFRENDIWKHFRAVQEDRVYDLTAHLFGMSATFDYPQALEELQEILYDDKGGASS